MSAQNDHQPGIRTPKQLVATVAAGFLVPIIVIVLLVQYVAHADKVGAGSDALTPKGIAERLRPVADVGFTLKEAGAQKQLQSGEVVYKAVCAACHDTGAAGAPKMGDNGAWSARLGQGQATLVTNAVKGIRAMPAKGGNPDLDPLEVERAVVYLANRSGGKLQEPAAPASKPATSDAPPAITAGAQVASATKPMESAPTQQMKAVTGGEDAGKADGKKVYEASCAACHATGAAGAPKLGDKAAWAPRLKQGNDTLYASALKGKGAMPPKGGAANASDDDIKAAVDYMTAAAK
jgi:cytochrome c5